MLFKVNDANLAHLKDVIEQFGKGWIHGDGNVYADEQPHKFRRDFTNPVRPGEPGAGSYWAFFDNVHDVPTTIDELKKLFMRNKEKQLEQIEEKSTKTEVKVVKAKTPTPVVKVDPHAEKAAELDKKESSLSDWSDKLTTATQNVNQKQQELAGKAKEMDDRAADLAKREKALEAKLAKLTAGSGETEKTGGK